MNTILHFDMFSGISGDMCAGALIDLGVDKKELTAVLDRLPIKGSYTLGIRSKTAGGLRGTDFSVKLKPHTHNHHHRTMTDIQKMLTAARLPERTRSLALAIFTTLAKAEGKVHRVKWNDVHFHEVGAVDSIVDIVAAAFCIEYLDAQAFTATPFLFGTGSVRTQHGLLPVPVPAVMELAAGRPCTFTKRPMELTTPTGAAIIRTLVTGPESACPEFELVRTGYGCGKRPGTEGPNMLRVMMGTARTVMPPAVQFEADIDDTTPETIGYLFEVLFKAGALDCVAMPVIMKKGRPGLRLSVLAEPGQTAAIRQMLFTETTTFGLRESTVQRTKLCRDFVKVTVKGRNISCKVGYLDGRPVSIHAEYEDCRACAQATGLPLKTVQAQAVRAAEAALKKKRK